MIFLHKSRANCARISSPQRVQVLSGVSASANWSLFPFTPSVVRWELSNRASKRLSVAYFVLRFAGEWAYRISRDGRPVQYGLYRLLFTKSLRTRPPSVKTGSSPSSCWIASTSGSMNASSSSTSPMSLPSNCGSG